MNGARSIIHCPAPKEEDFSGRCTITLECVAGPCMMKESEVRVTMPKRPFDVAAVDFLLWFWKRLFLALVVTFSACTALALSVVTVYYGLRHTRKLKGRGPDPLLEWLIVSSNPANSTEMESSFSEYRRTHSSESLPIPTKNGEHRRIRSSLPVGISSSSCPSIVDHQFTTISRRELSCTDLGKFNQPH